MQVTKQVEIKKLLEQKVKQYNQRAFIEDDPISIPHRFSKKQDIEIAGFFAALFAWGQRTTILNKSKDLLMRMDNTPFDFVQNHSENDLKRLIGFKHRTFQEDDLFFLISFLKTHYNRYPSLEVAFLKNHTSDVKHYNILCKQEEYLRNFYNYVFSHDHLKRTEKHIATPAKKSACKRINMFLRWMVRQDNTGVDFGIWKRIKPEELIIPLDVHVCRVAKKLGLLKSEKSNWSIAVNLTDQLRQFDQKDPVKYDFALFGMGVSEK